MRESTIASYSYKKGLQSLYPDDPPNRYYFFFNACRYCGLMSEDMMCDRSKGMDEEWSKSYYHNSKETPASDDYTSSVRKCKCGENEYGSYFEFNGTPALVKLMANPINADLIKDLSRFRRRKKTSRDTITNHVKVCPQCGIIVAYYDESCISPHLKEINLQRWSGDFFVCRACECEFDIHDTRWSIWPYDKLGIVLNNKGNIATLEQIRKRILDLSYKTEDCSLIR